MAVARAATSALDRRRRDGLDQDPCVVAVPGDRERRRLAVDVPRDHDRQLALEGQLALGQQRRAGLPPEPLPGVVELGDVGDPELAAAVVATDRQLEPERQAEVRRGGTRLVHGRRTARHGATAIPAASTNRRSASRSWVTVSGRCPGRTGSRASSAATTSAATCSSS